MAFLLFFDDGTVVVRLRVVAEDPNSEADEDEAEDYLPRWSYMYEKQEEHEVRSNSSLLFKSIVTIVTVFNNYTPTLICYGTANGKISPPPADFEACERGF